MKVLIPAQTVEIDPDEWAKRRRVDLANVREDVVRYFEGRSQREVERIGLDPESNRV